VMLFACSVTALIMIASAISKDNLGPGNIDHEKCCYIRKEKQRQRFYVVSTMRRNFTWSNTHHVEGA
jgi:hypothetical protein